jgi:hypothetical protein
MFRSIDIFDLDVSIDRHRCHERDLLQKLSAGRGRKTGCHFSLSRARRERELPAPSQTLIAYMLIGAAACLFAQAGPRIYSIHPPNAG